MSNENINLDELLQKKNNEQFQNINQGGQSSQQNFDNNNYGADNSNLGVQNGNNSQDYNPNMQPSFFVIWVITTTQNFSPNPNNPVFQGPSTNPIMQGQFGNSEENRNMAPAINLNDLMKNQYQSQGQNPSGMNPNMPSSNPYAGSELARVTANEVAFTEAEKRQIVEIRNHIDLTNTNDVLSYGNSIQKGLSAFSDGVLEKVKVKDSGDVVEGLLTDLSMSVKEVDESKSKSFLKSIPFVGSLVKKGEELKTKSEKCLVQVEKITAGLENAKIQMMKDIVIYDNLYEENLKYFQALNMYIEAGEQKLREAHEVLIPSLREQASNSNEPMAMQVVSDFEQSVNRFEKRVHDLKISKTIAVQTAPQIRLIQNNDKVLIDRVNSAVYNTIPLWKNQIVIAIGLSNQQKVLQLNKNLSDMTNELLKKNAEALRLNSIETAKENERSIVDVETVKKVNEELIATIEETLKIQKEGRAKRLAAEKELVQIEGRLKQALLDNMNNRGNYANGQQYFEKNVTPH